MVIHNKDNKEGTWIVPPLTAAQKKENLIKVAKAMFVLNNECIKLREMKYLLGKQGQVDVSKEANNKRDKYYRLLKYTYRFLYRARWIELDGYYIQKVKDLTMKIYKLNFGSVSYYVSEHHFEPTEQDKNAKKLLGMFEGLMPMAKVEVKGMTADEAERILIDFTKCKYSRKYGAYKSEQEVYGQLLDLYKRKNSFLIY